MSFYTIEGAYLDVAKHVTVGRLALCHIDREPSVEDDDKFAEGGAAKSASGTVAGTIVATVYWLVGGKRFSVKCSQEYCYSDFIRGNVACVSGSSNFFITPSDMLLTRKELAFIEIASRIASNSKYIDASEVYDGADVHELPRVFINHICRELKLKDSNYDEKTWNEWVAIENAADAAAEAEIDKRTHAFLQPKHVYFAVNRHT